MHEADILPAPLVWLLTVFVVLVTLGIFRHHANTRAARKVELRRLQQLLAAENERAEELAEQEYSSMLASTKSSVSSSTSPSQSPCAVCQALTTTRCSRCKSVHYCSSQCQMQHWKQGHKNECTQPKKSKLAVRLAVEPIKKFESKYQTTSDDHVIASKPPEVETRTLDNVETRTLDKVETRTLDKVENVTPDGCLVKPKKILFSYNRFVQYFNWDIRRPPCGLINCGNSCFANVILQCLMYTRPLVAYLLEGSHRAECRRNDWCFMCEFQEHAMRCFSNQVPFSPFRILSRLRDIGNHLGYGRQEDAHEFMRFAVDSMQSICLDQFGGEKMVDPRSQETTLVQYMFGGHLQSQVKCMQCGHESNRYENMMDLTVEIEGAVESLEDALAQFTAPEWLDGENKYKCDRCNAYVKASKRLAIHEAPNILTIALKRFQSGKFGKINKRVTFPEALNMLPYMSGEGDKPPIYKLYAVVVHVDMLNASFFGHYICYVRDMEGTWYKIDDSKVKEVDTEKVMCQKAYMLMYSRSLARPGPEAAAGSLASSLTDISVSQGRECSSSSCKYQRSSSIGKVHGPLHQVSPIIERTLVNGSLINGDDDDTLLEESVGPSYSTLQSTAIERVIDLGFDEPTASDSNTSSTSQDIGGGQRCTKRRLENDDVSKPPALCRTRSLSCPPVGRPALTPLDSAHQLADDLPRSFGYSCREDIPFKRQHILQDGACSMDVDSDQEQFVGEEDSNNIGSVVTLSSDLEEAESILENGIPPETLSECRKPPESLSENRKPSGVEKTVLKPVFARGFLDRQKSSTEYASPTKGYTPFVV